MLSHTIHKIEGHPAGCVGGLVGAAGLRIDLDKVEGARTGLTGLVEHHGNLERGGAAGIKGALGVGGGIQYIRADGDVDHVGVLADDVDGLLNGGLPAVELDLPGGDHSGAGLLGLAQLHGEVGVVVIGEGADGHDLQAHRLGLRLEGVEDAGGVRIAVVVDGGDLGAQVVLLDVVGRGLALVWVGEAGLEHVVAALGHLGGGGGGGQLEDAVIMIRERTEYLPVWDEAAKK